MGKLLAGIVFLAIAIFILAVAVGDLEHDRAATIKNGVEDTSILAKVDVGIIRYSGYALGALGLILIAAGISRKLSLT